MIDIDRFTGVEDVRAWLNAPWRRDGKLYATNGHFMIELADDGREAVDATDKHPNCSLLFEKRTHGAFFTLPDLAQPVPCESCAGSGMCYREDCDDCDGNGFFDHGRYEYECKHCDSEGCFTYHGAGVPEGRTESRCRDCYGLGERVNYREDPGTETVLGELKFATRLLRPLLALPGIEVACCPEPNAALWFKFDGGRGLVMPMRI